MRAIYSNVGRDNLFPSAFTAFCSGAVGNISFQSCNAVYQTIRANKDALLKQPVTCSLNNVIYAGIVTASYMRFSFVCLFHFSYIKKLHCGDFSFHVDLHKRYFGGYLTGLTAISYLGLTEVISAFLKDGWKGISWTSVLTTFKQRALTVAPLVMMQQSFYDHLRILEDPYVPPSYNFRFLLSRAPVFFSTGLVTGVAAQFLVQPFINLTSSPSPSSSFCFLPSFLWRGVLYRCCMVCIYVAIRLFHLDCSYDGHFSDHARCVYGKA